MGEDLRLPNIATWWCGQQAERASVIADLDNLAIGGAFGNPVLRFPQNQPVIAGLLTAEEKTRLIASIGERGIDYVGQEVVNLSTTPVWNDDRLTPRPFVLRVYAARDAERLDDHAGRLLPHLRPRRRARRLDGRRRAIGRRLGARRQAGRDDHPAADH